MTVDKKRAVVLFGHGSRDPLWHKPIEAIAAQIVCNQPHLSVRCAYLEISSPDLGSACQQLVNSGVADISIVPLFLGVGRHAREDLPDLVLALRARHPGVIFELKPAVGEDPRLIALLAQISAE